MSVFLKPFLSKPCERGASAADGYSTQADFCQLFTEHMGSLYRLALVLTADYEKAEHCYLSAFEECLGSKTVFRGWAHTWAKRATIRIAIRTVLGSQTAIDTRMVAKGIENEISGPDFLVARISNLEPFDRFVYVMSVLERMSDRDCALLLDCFVRDVMDAKTRALQLGSDNLCQNLPTREKELSVGTR